MKNFKEPTRIKVPWWTWPLRRWNQWRNDIADKKAAEVHKIEEEKRRKTPVFYASINGLTKYVDHPEPNEFVTHIWWLYETPEGKRSYKEKKSTGRVHPWEGMVVQRWVNHQIELDLRELAKGNVAYRPTE